MRVEWVLPPFRPLVSNPHLLTILGNFWPRNLDMLAYPMESRLYQTEPDVQVRVETQRPTGDPSGDVVDRELEDRRQLRDREVVSLLDEPDALGRLRELSFRLSVDELDHFLPPAFYGYISNAVQQSRGGLGQ